MVGGKGEGWMVGRRDGWDGWWEGERDGMDGGKERGMGWMVGRGEGWDGWWEGERDGMDGGKGRGMGWMVGRGEGWDGWWEGERDGMDGGKGKKMDGEKGSNEYVSLFADNVFFHHFTTQFTFKEFNFSLLLMLSFSHHYVINTLHPCLLTSSLTANRSTILQACCQ